MFQSDYRREMDALNPGPEALERLDALLAGGGERERPRRRFGRRAAVALALCAALAVTAVAAGPGLRTALAEHLGPFGAFLAPLTGSSTSAGIKLEVVGVLSDGASARFYLTAQDQAGGRLDGHTDAVFNLEGALSWGARCLAFDGESNTLLLELEAIGLPEGNALALTGGTLVPGSYRVAAEPEPGDDLETFQTYETLPGLSTSTGFDGEDQYRLRVKLEEGYSLSSRSTAFVYFSDGSAWSTGAEQVTHLPDGQELHLEAVTRETLNQVDRIWLVTSYTGSQNPIQGNWSLTLTTAETEGMSTPEGFSLALSGGGTAACVSVSPLGVVVEYTGPAAAVSDDDVCVTLADGSRPAWGDFSGWNWGGEGAAIWRFETPVEPEDISSVTLQGVSVPME